LEGTVEIVSDSTYVVNCFRDQWWEGWLRRGWKNSKKEPVANRDLWEPLIDLYRARATEITFRWVKGHAGNEWNDIADRLAVEASHSQVGRTGVGRPTDLGDPDDFAEGFVGRSDGGASIEPPATASPAKAGPDGIYNSTWRPLGRALAITGLQPPAMGGFDDNPTRERVGRLLAEILEAKHRLHPDLIVLTGLRLGAETLGAEIAAEIGVPYAAVLPYPDPDAKWPALSRH
ncbi:MAG: hypothetical protein GY773_15290, partial [Actinomycetia bacterium]|nr:hypothetical protein [Actinomycetes bacterium]